jgi:hypothetical protein
MLNFFSIKDVDAFAVNEDIFVNSCNALNYV